MSANVFVGVPVAAEVDGRVAVGVGGFVPPVVPEEAQAVSSRHSAKKGKRHREIYLVMYGSCRLGTIVGAIIHYALATHHRPKQGVMN